MSFLSEIHSYYAGNSTLTNALPASKIYTGEIPEGTALPYAVVVPISSIPEVLSCSSVITTFDFQISLFHSDPDLCESVSNTIAGQFHGAAVASSTAGCFLVNGPLLLVDESTPSKVYHGMMEFQLMGNRDVSSLN